MNRILFLNAVTSSPVPQGSDGDHMKIYIWQGLVVSDEYRQRPLLRWQQPKTSTRLAIEKPARATHGLQPLLAREICKPDGIFI